MPKNFAFADQGIKPVSELESDDYPVLNITEQTDNRLKDEVIQDYSARNIQTPQYEVSQSMKNISPYVKSITSRPDEVYLSGDNKYTYVKFYNDNGKVNALAVNAKVSKDGIKINRWYQIEDADRLRKQQLVYRKQ